MYFGIHVASLLYMSNKKQIRSFFYESKCSNVNFKGSNTKRETTGLLNDADHYKV